MRSGALKDMQHVLCVDGHLHCCIPLPTLRRLRHVGVWRLKLRRVYVLALKADAFSLENDGEIGTVVEQSAVTGSLNYLSKYQTR